MKSIVPFLAEKIQLSVESAGWEKLYRKVDFLHTVAEIMLLCLPCHFSYKGTQQGYISYPFERYFVNT